MARQQHPANVFREHGAQFIPGQAQLKMFVSGWESPSNRLLTALYQTGSNDVAAAQYTMEAPPIVPDPASHRCGSTARLWDFREGILPKLEAWYRKHLAKDASESDATSAGKNSLAGETNDAASAHGTAP
ncbi:MAG: hypothetical protein WBV82_26270, partial [Myxococcaceae bacterium]